MADAKGSSLDSKLVELMVVRSVELSAAKLVVETARYSAIVAELKSVVCWAQLQVVPKAYLWVERLDSKVGYLVVPKDIG